MRALIKPVTQSLIGLLMMSAIPLVAQAEDDITRKQLGQAIINYEAAARMKEYQLNKELLFSQAPGTKATLEAVKSVNIASFLSSSFEYTTKGYLTVLRPYTNLESIEVNGNSTSIRDLPALYLSPVEFFKSIKTFVLGGDQAEAQDQLKTINPLAIMQHSNLKASELTQPQALQLMDLLVNPFPMAMVDPEITVPLNCIKQNGGDSSSCGEMGTFYEKISRSIAESAALGLSMNALGDIVARRVDMPANGGEPQSMMQVMEKYNKDHFMNTEWYKGLAAAPEAALLREMAQMMAFSTFMQYQQFRLQEQEVAMVATVNANIARLTTSFEKMMAQIVSSSNQ